MKATELQSNEVEEVSMAQGKASSAVTLLIGTKKGFFTLRSDEGRKQWALSEPGKLGNIIHHVVSDPRDPNVWLMATKTGHLGPALFRSADGGKTWEESKQPPAFPKAPEGEKGKAVKSIFWLTPSNAKEPNVWYAGSVPAGLWRTEDAGVTWNAVAGFNSHPRYQEWAGNGGVPDDFETILHSINVHPTDPNYILCGVSSGGVFETKDGGKTWACLNKGCAADFMPDPDPEFGHDPHCVALHPLQPSRLYQQNHCGIYRMDRDKAVWERIGNNMPKDVGDSGFVVGLHPRDVNTIWVFPMDSSDVWPRVSPGGKPSVFKSTDGGDSWRRCGKGWPSSGGWLTVKRQCMAVDAHDSVGVYVGTTSGEIWGSTDEGESWTCIAKHLPHVISVEVAA